MTSYSPRQCGNPVLAAALVVVVLFVARRFFGLHLLRGSPLVTSGALALVDLVHDFDRAANPRAATVWPRATSLARWFGQPWATQEAVRHGSWASPPCLFLLAFSSA
jgi:hypothetical protein